MFRYYAIDSFSPTNYNWGHWSNAGVHRSAEAGAGDVRSGGADEAAGQAHAIVVDEAPWLFIVHDLNPRAMSKKVHGLPSGAELVSGLHADHHGIGHRFMIRDGRV